MVENGEVPRGVRFVVRSWSHHHQIALALDFIKDPVIERTPLARPVDDRSFSKPFPGEGENDFAAQPEVSGYGECQEIGPAGCSADESLCLLLREHLPHATGHQFDVL